MLSSHRRDGLIAWMKEMLNHSFVLDAKKTYFDTFRYFEQMVEEDRMCVAAVEPRISQIRTFVPTIGSFHTPLPLEQAFRDYDAKYAVTSRRHIAPTFNEIRHILNLAQVYALRSSLRFISFDGDQTLYEDGGNFEHDSALSIAIRTLLKTGVNVALITAAGYGHEGPRYETRLQGLLAGFQEHSLSDEALNRFFVVGGECNYYLRCVREDERVQLKRIPDEMWEKAAPGPRPYSWSEPECKRILDIAEESFRSSAKELRLRAKIIRKPRGLGIIAGGPDSVKSVPTGHGSEKLKREALDEVALRAQEELKKAEPQLTLLYCCFNGGRDAWVDVGNKRVGVEAMQSLLHITEKNTCLHVGDQFLNMGNDYAARDVSPCIWITNPRETEKILAYVLEALHLPPATPKSSGPRKAPRNGPGPNDSVYM